MITVRRADQRHHDRRRKREVWHTFDPRDRTDRLADGFGALETLDENRLPPRADVSCRARDEAEIVTYVCEGSVAYDDSMGHSGVIHTGEFRRTIAARGTRQRQANASRADWAHVFSIRLRRTASQRVSGREQKRFSAAERRGELCIVASPDAQRGSLRLHQDT